MIEANRWRRRRRRVSDDSQISTNK